MMGKTAVLLMVLILVAGLSSAATLVDSDPRPLPDSNLSDMVEEEDSNDSRDELEKEVRGAVEEKTEQMENQKQVKKTQDSGFFGFLESIFG